MQTTIRLRPSFKANDSLILLINDKGNLPKGVFSPKEAAFIRQELKADKKSIVINQYKRIIGLFQPDLKNDTNKLLEKCRKAGETFLSSINKYKLQKIVVVDQIGNPELALAITEGLALGNYQFLKYRKEKKKEENSLREIDIVCKNLKQGEVSALKNLVDAVYHARTLVNEPQSWLTATQLSDEFVSLGNEAGFDVEVLDKTKIKAHKMGGLLAVNLGSIQPPTGSRGTSGAWCTAAAVGLARIANGLSAPDLELVWQG